MLLFSSRAGDPPVTEEQAQQAAGLNASGKFRHSEKGLEVSDDNYMIIIYNYGVALDCDTNLRAGENRLKLPWMMRSPSSSRLRGPTWSETSIGQSQPASLKGHSLHTCFPFFSPLWPGIIHATCIL